MSHKKQTEMTYEKKISDVLLFIQNNLDNTLILNVLASITNISKYHFHRIFNAVTGENVLQYVKRIRLENAAFRLKHASESITDIAFDSGYNTVSAFIKSFHKQFSCSPGEYRKNDVCTVIRKNQETHNYEPADTESGRYVIKLVAEHSVYYVRKIGKYSVAAETAWAALFKFVEKNNDKFNYHNQHIGITYDSPEITAAEHIRYDACISYDPHKTKIDKLNNIGIQKIPGGRFAVFTHTGGYAQLWNTYNYIYSDWLLNSKHEIENFPSYSIYKQRSNQDQEIEIYIPIK